MRSRIEVTLKKGLKDAAGDELKKRVKKELGIRLKDVHFVDVYNFGDELPEGDLKMLGREVFSDSVSQDYHCEKPAFQNSWRIEVGFLPGVTDNVGKAAKEAVADRISKNLEIYYSRVYSLEGISGEDAAGRISKIVYNPLVEKARIHAPGIVPTPYTPRVKLEADMDVERISLHMSAERFSRLAKERLLALNTKEFEAIKKHFKKQRVYGQRKKVGLDRKITDVELEALAQTWSEHCKHKIFNAKIRYSENGDNHAINSIFRTFIKGATEQVKKPYVVSVFKDNGGIIKFNHDYDIAVKVETHNSPSALDPYGGALTGVLGVQRDVMGTGLGANPIANIDVLCFGPLGEKDIPRGVLHPKTIYEGVVKGVQDGGNKMGIPTVNGSIIFEKGYLCRPLVYCGTVGIMPSSVNGRRTSEKAIKPGHLAVMAGGRIGKDGIHGATFSSQQLDESTPQSVVQIGDPFTQKKMLDFMIEARDMLLYDAVTDNGAGGLSSSIGELAQFSGGCEIYLEKCPLKYSGLKPWEILLSESQERMTLAVPPGNMEKLRELAKKHDVEITAVGKFTNSKKFHVMYGEKTVAYLDMDFLHEGVPQMKLTASYKRLMFPPPDIGEFRPQEDLLRLLSSPNVASKENVIRRYDHEVKGLSVIKPIMLGPCDAAVIKPLYDSEEGIVVSHGICPRYIHDGYAMASLAFDEAVRNAIAVGARFGYLACLDNFSWPDPIKSEKTPDGDYKLGMLVRSCLALYDCATNYNVPIISGKDSMKNDYYAGDRKYSIPPTLLITVVGKIDSVKRAVSSEFKEAGDMVYVLGSTKDELGGSEYYKLYGGVGDNPPKVRPEEHVPLYKALSNAISDGIVRSVHDVSDGGIAVAFAECAAGGNIGASLDVEQVPSDTPNEDALLFSESPGRFVVSIAPEMCDRFEKAMQGCVFAKAGRTRGDRRIILKKGDRFLVNLEVDELRKACSKSPEW